MRLRLWWATLAVGLVLASVVPPAEAATPVVPLRCGMTVDSDVTVVLEADLYCRTKTAVVAVRPPGAPIPKVTIDLNGHTLRGASRIAGSQAITAYAPGTADLEVVDGRIENWTLGIGGDGEILVSHVKLVGNRTAMACGSCWIERSYLKGSVVGVWIESGNLAYLEGNTISHNTTGVSVRGITTTADLRRNTFRGNDSAIYADCDPFVNDAGNVFIDNARDLVRGTCS